MPAKKIGRIRCLTCTYLHDIKEGINTFTKKEYAEYIKTETHKFFKLKRAANGEIIYGSFCKQCNSITSVKRVDKLFTTKFYSIEIISREDFLLLDWKKIDNDLYFYIKENLMF